MKEEHPNTATLHDIRMDGQISYEPMEIYSALSFRIDCFSLFRNWDSSSADLLRKILTSILSMNSFVSETSAGTTDSKELSSVIFTELDFALKAAVYNITRKEINTLQLMSTVLVVIQFEIGAEENEKENRKESESNKGSNFWNDRVNYVTRPWKLNETHQNGAASTSA